MNQKELQELRKRFTVNSDDTGRFFVYSPRTGITYFVEPLDTGARVSWGNVIPGKDKVETVTAKGRGGVHPDESMITAENGMENIQLLPPGTSPHGEIDRVDDLRYEQGFRPGFRPVV